MGMTKRSFGTRLDPELIAALHELKRRDGVPQAEAIRRALLAFFKTKGIKVTTPKKGGK
jgi:hypothetical protein